MIAGVSQPDDFTSVESGDAAVDLYQGSKDSAAKSDSETRLCATAGEAGSDHSRYWCSATAAWICADITQRRPQSSCGIVCSAV